MGRGWIGKAGVWSNSFAIRDFFLILMEIIEVYFLFGGFMGSLGK
jgi:hypothetical protein